MHVFCLFDCKLNNKLLLSSLIPSVYDERFALRSGELELRTFVCCFCNFNFIKSQWSSHSWKFFVLHVFIFTVCFPSCKLSVCCQYLFIMSVHNNSTNSMASSLYLLIPGCIAVIWLTDNAQHSAIAMGNPVPRRMVAIFDYDPRESSPNADIEVTLHHIHIW